MEFKVPKRHILRPKLSTDMVQRVLWRERQKRCPNRNRQGPMGERCCYNKIIRILFREENEDKRRQGNYIFLIFFFKIALWGIFKKKSAHSFFGAWSLLLVHFWFRHREAILHGPSSWFMM